MRKLIMAAAVAAFPIAAFAQAPPQAQQSVAQDWQILQGAKAAEDGAIARLQQDLSAMIRDGQQNEQQLTAAQHREADLQKQLAQAQHFTVPANRGLPPNTLPHSVPVQPHAPSPHSTRPGP